VREGGKEFQDRLKCTHIGSRVARLYGYIPNVPMMSDYENVLVAIVRRDGKATGEVDGGPLVSEDRERVRRVCGEGRNEAGRGAQDTRDRRRVGEDRYRRRTQGDRSGRELGTSVGDAPPKGVEVTERSRERERGGNFRTREAVRAGILRMKPRFRARTKVEREGDPNARCRSERWAGPGA
jgi:hypothetical protein